MATDDLTPDIESSDQLEIDPAKAIERSVFLGGVPFANIKDGIEGQFRDYINLEDDTNYVDIFYDEYHVSTLALERDDVESVDERREALSRIHDDFIAFICEKFATRFTISFDDYDGENDDYDELEYAVREAYDFFIMDGRKNIKNVIVKDIMSRLHVSPNDEKAFYDEIRNLFPLYSPLFTDMSVPQFIQYAENEEMMDLYERGEILGNFLRKYSPKLYQNEDLEVEIINEICLAKQEMGGTANGQQ